VLLAAAGRLPNGRAVGVDLWRSGYQSGNATEATQRNAEAAGVADRVELHTGDMTALPFSDGEFDVIVSSLAIHNIGKPDGRQDGRQPRLRDASGARVIRPTGQRDQRSAVSPTRPVTR